MTPAMRLLTTFAQEHASDVARMLERGSAEQVAPLLDRLERDDAARLLARMTPRNAAEALLALTREAAGELLDELGASRAALLLSHLGAGDRQELLAQLKGRHADAVRRLLIHAARTAGSVMDAMVLSVADDATITDALDHVRRHADSGLFYVYVVDRDQHLVGVITLAELLGADPAAAVRALMTDRPEYIGARASLLAIAAHPGWRRHHALPVVDDAGVLLGAVRYETARRIEHELGQAVRQSDVGQTASALGQLYAIGALGMVDWVNVLVPSKRKREAQ